MKKLLFVLGVGLVIYWLSPRNISFDAISRPESGLTVTMTISSIVGLHSDWERRIEIQKGTSTIQRNLFEDTGWWRGSNLYQHSSGVYVIHEGQAGCFGFSIEPLTFDVQQSISCAKLKRTTQHHVQSSRYYEDMIYLGAFIETPNDPSGQPFSFALAAERPEVELPERL